MQGVGVLGVVEADYLQPTHNKQNFDNTKAFRALMAKLAQMLKYYWFERVESVPRNPYGGEYALEDGVAQGVRAPPARRPLCLASVPSCCQDAGIPHNHGCICLTGNPFLSLPPPSAICPAASAVAASGGEEARGDER